MGTAALTITLQARQGLTSCVLDGMPTLLGTPRNGDRAGALTLPDGQPQRLLVSSGD